MQWKTAVWSTKIYQLCCRGCKQLEIFKTRPRHPTIKRLDHVTITRLHHGWPRHPTINSILQLNEASFMYKNLYVSADWNVKKINFDLRNKVWQRITINGSDVHIVYRRTAVGHKAVSVSGAKLWNSIPTNIRNSNTIVTFKSHMYQHLLEHQ